MLGTDTAIDLLLGEKPTLQQKILSFFKKSAQDYSSDEALSRESRKLLRNFKKTFDAFTARNRSRNAEAGIVGDKTDGRRYSYEGKAFDGKSIYKSNSPKGTPKKAKSERILKYITNVWSKEPISLVISNGETSRTIKAKFDPTIDETQNTPTDASKIAGGNRHGNGTEKRVTLDLADDYYQIVQESKYNYSKEETGKDNPAHEGVKLWHYFVDDIYFIEQENSGLVPYRVTINVKEKDNGDFVYSFNAEKAEESSTQQTLHAAVNTRKGANGELFIDSIPDSAEKVNTSDKNSSDSRRYAMENIDPAAVALPRTAGKANISYGQLAKMRAQDRTGKSYSKKDASDIVDRLPVSGFITEENKELIVESVWQLLNEAMANDRMTQGELQLAVHDIALYFVSSLFKGETVTSLDAIDAKNIVATLKKGISMLEISIDDRAEMKNNAGASIYKRIPRPLEAAGSFYIISE